MSKTQKIIMTSRQWLMTGIKDGSIILHSDGSMSLNKEAFLKSNEELVKKAQYRPAGLPVDQLDSAQLGQIGMYGVPGGVLSGIKGKGIGSISSGMTTVPGYTTSLIGDWRLGPAGTASPTGQLIEAVQGTPTSTPGPAGAVVTRNAPTAGVRMGLKQPFSAVGSEFAAARAKGSGRAMSTVKGLTGGAGAIPQGLATAGKGLAGAAASGGVRGWLAGNFISAAGSLAAWGIHKGTVAAIDWATGANNASGNLRTPKGAQNFAKAQELLSSKVMPMMYGQAAGPNQKLEILNGYITELAKELESDPGYQAAVSGQIAQQVNAEMPEDLSVPALSVDSSQFNPYNQ
jgi:hypothetical protein